MEHTDFVLQWHITHRCNLRCSHCYQEDYTAFADRAQLETVLHQYETLLRTYGWKGHLNITGGEPLLHDDLFWLLEQAAKRQITTAVLTNGTLIGRREARLMKALGVSYVQISLDGMPKTHDAIRGKDSFERALKGISALQTQKISTTVSFTAQCENRRDIKKLARLCAVYGVNKLWFDRVVLNAAEDKHGLSLTTKDYQKLCRTAAKLHHKHLISCGRALQFLPCREKNIYHCTAGSRLLALLADGTVMPCRRLPMTVGQIRDNDLLTIYRDSSLLRQLRDAPVPRGCVNCSYRTKCCGGAKCIAYAKTGQWDISDPDCPYRESAD